MKPNYNNCTSCRRCESICPENAPIADIMQLFRELEQTDDLERVTEIFNRDFRKRTGCVNCGRCLPYCPEKINIPYYVLSAKEEFE